MNPSTSQSSQEAPDKQMTATIPLELLEAYVALQRAVEVGHGWMLIKERSLAVRKAAEESKTK